MPKESNFFSYQILAKKKSRFYGMAECSAIAETLNSNTYRYSVDNGKNWKDSEFSDTSLLLDNNLFANITDIRINCGNLNNFTCTNTSIKTILCDNIGHVDSLDVNACKKIKNLYICNSKISTLSSSNNKLQ
ncbi:hypothetical protein FACS189459_5810 [Bacilli bacterium]|nr:hypothetical protein FACS189459_5810 [Bacilli bacterium]